MQETSKGPGWDSSPFLLPLFWQKGDTRRHLYMFHIDGKAAGCLNKMIFINQLAMHSLQEHPARQLNPQWWSMVWIKLGPLQGWRGTIMCTLHCWCKGFYLIFIRHWIWHYVLQSIGLSKHHAYPSLKLSTTYHLTPWNINKVYALTVNDSYRIIDLIQQHWILLPLQHQLNIECQLV